MPERLRERHGRGLSQGDLYARVGIAAAALGMADRRDLTGLLPEISLPTLLIVGEEDGIAPPEEMKEMAAAIPGAEFVAVANAGLSGSR